MPAKRKAEVTAASNRSKRTRAADATVTLLRRSRAIASPSPSISASVEPKKRGRPPKTSATGGKAFAEIKRTKDAAISTARRNKLNVEQPQDASPHKAKRGRPSKKIKADLVDGEPRSNSNVDDQRDEPQYWLMKAEPKDRFENGVNVKFSIDDLAAATKPEPWDGVRNYAARNNMRSMRKGDLAFFYHSNCAVPGIVGVMRIVQEHSVDESAFNPEHPYFDGKSTRDNPKWDVVHVEFVKRFDIQITLKMVNDNAATTGELANMQLIRQKRLSVTQVSSREWSFILDMAGEVLGTSELENPQVLSDGNESDQREQD